MPRDDWRKAQWDYRRRREGLPSHTYDIPYQESKAQYLQVSDGVVISGPHQTEFAIVLEVLYELSRKRPVVWMSLLKQGILARHPSFSERTYGYGTFKEMLEDMKEHRLIDLKYDDARSNWIVSAIDYSQRAEIRTSSE